MKILHDIFSRILRWIILRFLSLFYARYEKCIAIGSWSGERYADNSRYLIEYLDTNYPEYTLYWVGNKKIKEEVLANTKNVVFLEQNTLKTDVKLLKCKYFFFSQFHTADISRSNVYKGAVLCYLHHGMPIKKWGADGLNQGVGKHSWLSKLSMRISGADINYDFFVTSSPEHDKTNCTSLSFKGCTMEKNLHTGTPRNDMLVNFDSENALKFKRKYAQQFEFNENVKVILYLPTYRRISNDIFSFSKVTDEQRSALNEILEKHNAVLFEKSHIAEKEEIIGTNSERIRFADKNTNIQEMMLFTDLLISDYSGAYLDFILLDRSVIHFVYDYDYYKDVDSGLYYELEDFVAGCVSRDFDSMVLQIDDLLGGKDTYSEKRRQVINRFMTYEKGNASQQIIDNVIFWKTNL